VKHSSRVRSLNIIILKNRTSGNNAQRYIGKWKVNEEELSILFFGDDGKVYFTSTNKDNIIQSNIDIRTGKHLTDVRQIWTGPHSLKNSPKKV